MRTYSTALQNNFAGQPDIEAALQEEIPTGSDDLSVVGDGGASGASQSVLSASSAVRRSFGDGRSSKPMNSFPLLDTVKPSGNCHLRERAQQTTFCLLWWSDKAGLCYRTRLAAVPRRHNDLLASCDSVVSL